VSRLNSSSFYSVEVTGVVVGPEATDITEFRSQGVVVRAVALQQGGVVLAVVNGSSGGFVLLGASPLQEALSVGQSRSPSLGQDSVVLTLELSLHSDLIIDSGCIEVEGAVAHQAGPAGVRNTSAFKGGRKSVLALIDSLSVGPSSIGFFSLEMLVHGVHELLLEDVVLSEVAQFSL